MRRRLLTTDPRLLTILVTAASAAVLWAAWLGWDQHRDVQPDGSTTGPYEVWQVIGLMLTLLAPVYWAASRGFVVPTMLGVTAGLTAASAYDWSDDASGLFVIGAGLVMVGSLAATAAVAALIASTRGNGRRVVPPAA